MRPGSVGATRMSEFEVARASGRSGDCGIRELFFEAVMCVAIGPSPSRLKAAIKIIIIIDNNKDTGSNNDDSHQSGDDGDINDGV